MLYHLLRDMLDVLRLRYQQPDHYRYTPPAVIAVLVLIGLVNAAGMSPMFGNSIGTIAFAILLTVVKWLLLGHVMRTMLHYYGAPKLPLWGFILVSEALVIPALAMFYLPSLAFVGVFWQVWTFWVQAIGLMKMGNVSALRILLGYVVYVLLLMVAGALLLALFGQLGLMDLQSISEQMNSMVNNGLPRE
ncbi:hypothetical protein LVJ83_02275 [Uruburuella testudinis]|uniref:Yip1 domain-containing protein n=1 Tax=Uruburuella testudinis TaxID=1282863 RepID=A0ABY4DTF6_9NEIS|nr:hypothetical protein [Uruburuella testudinis]UOO82324.1 hypothetical protein LVJ83_02275 [Uruburuella testudinis]